MRWIDIIGEYVTPEKHAIKKTAVAGLLQNYPLATSAMEFASEYHTGIRKDNITPEFDHQVSIVRFLLKITPYCSDADEILTAGFLHDVAEDYNVPLTTFKDRFGPKVGKAVVMLTKVIREKKRLSSNYFNALSQDPIASIVKGADRVHNMSTLGTFSAGKKAEYGQETDDWIIPMLEKAKENFPQQAKAYDMILRVLRWQSNQVKP